MSARTVIAGFIPLLDSALLVSAAAMGFAAREGLDLRLVRETSWANIRDRISVGHFDVAHMLAPMPIAANLGLTSLSVPMTAPITLGHGGNAITVSTEVWTALIEAGSDIYGDPGSTSTALHKVTRFRKQQGDAPLRFAVVHPYSGHAYELRYWLATSGIDPDTDVEITVLPPPLIPDALATGRIDGCCVGEPWNSKAVFAGTGRILTFKEAIWPSSPEKVLGTTADWAALNPDTLAALLRALQAASAWCGDLQNAGELANLLSLPEYLDCPAEICLPALTGALRLDRETTVAHPGILRFAGAGILRPQPEHGLWFYSQMVRWGQTSASERAARIVAETFSSRTYDAVFGGNGTQATGFETELFDGLVPLDPAALSGRDAGVSQAAKQARQ